MPDRLTIHDAAIADLRPAPYNPRAMSKHDAEALKRSLVEFGAVDPAVVNADGTIIGGHMRVLAAQELGWESFPVVYVDLPEEKAKALNVALNRISGEWDDDKLSELLYELAQEPGNLLLTGFEASEIDKLLGEVAGAEPEVAPVEPEPACAKCGSPLRCGVCE